MRLIDADALVAAYDAAHDGPPGKARTLILNAPTVDAVPVVHGRWIKMTGMLPPEYHGHYECSECQWHMNGIRNSWTREEELRYCPNCGAKMGGERRDKDALD